ncbi:NAD(P)H-binding protein [Halolamina sp. CBA1230]|uniref:SDR family oxidoreductase n=1 Tax=Halolamina sp. CBA1230 TaxID=1853690 RepID=UPI0009A1AFDD|nr:NAD(P)H-binding protein [Halolamina sp. CBA1230]QKY20443.1 NAD(P)H-binding protein [Halolamina sp. CBA1230]
MTRTLVTGATGTLGTALRRKLAAAGREVRAASRSPPGRSEETVEWIELDLTDGTGVESAVDGVDVVVHAATAPRGDTETVDVNGTERLLAAAADAEVANFVYPSIVGVDEIPFAYYEHKAAAEAAVEESAVPSTIVRATQFHSFVADLLDSVAKLPVWPLPTEIPLQPVAADEVAAAIVDHATPTAGGRTDPVGGPAVRSVGDLARAYRDARGLRRPVVRLPLPGSTAAGFRTGHATCPDHAVGTVTWEAWLAGRYAE